MHYENEMEIKLLDAVVLDEAVSLDLPGFDASFLGIHRAPGRKGVPGSWGVKGH